MAAKLKEGDVVSAIVVIKSITKQPTKNFVKLLINDGQNELNAYMWDTVAPMYEDDPKVEVKEKDTVSLKGQVGSYNNKQKIDVISISKTKLTIKLPSLTSEELDIYNDKFYNLRTSIKDNDFEEILDCVFETALTQFKTAPAAKGNHQAYIGGLLEHSVGVAELCDVIYQQNPKNINRDLLITGALLHDIGKIKEYVYDTVFDRATIGKLIGHTSLGVMIISRLVPDDVNIKKMNEVIHLILSHHGKRDWGAPVEPLMKEAVILHHCDMLDSYNSRFNEVKNSNLESEWSAYDEAYGRSWYLHTLK